MKKKLLINTKDSINAEKEVIKILESNLFKQTIDKSIWEYTNDFKELVMSISYTILENKVEFEIWMINEDLKILKEKIENELKTVL